MAFLSHIASVALCSQKCLSAAEHGSVLHLTNRRGTTTDSRHSESFRSLCHHVMPPNGLQFDLWALMKTSAGHVVTVAFKLGWTQ